MEQPTPKTPANTIVSRPKLTTADIDAVLARVRIEIVKRINRVDGGALVSKAEVYGRVGMSFNDFQYACCNEAIEALATQLEVLATIAVIASASTDTVSFH